MKRVSLLLSVLCAAGVPLSAAALDYGPEQRMVAAEASAPALPSLQPERSSFTSVLHQGRPDDDVVSATPPISSAESNSHPSAVAHIAHAPAVPTPGPTRAPRTHSHSVLSWQSLLPGSIQ